MWSVLHVDGWDMQADEPRGGGYCLGEYPTQGQAIRVARLEAELVGERDPTGLVAVTTPIDLETGQGGNLVALINPLWPNQTQTFEPAHLADLCVETIDTLAQAAVVAGIDLAGIDEAA